MKKTRLLPEDRRIKATAQDCARYARELKELVDCRTVFRTDGLYRCEYDRFYAALEKLFPVLHAKAEKLTFGDGCFFYRLPCENPGARLLLMSHHDVVDIGEGWQTDAFHAEEKDGKLYGRGTIDTKTPLYAMLRAAEDLLTAQWDFGSLEVYIGSSHNEEVGGDGMVLAADYFRSQGIRFDVILDEGGAITQGMIPGVSAKSAMVAVHEKSRHRYSCVASQGDRGHTGLTPSEDSVIARMSGFIAEVNRANIYRGRFYPEVAATFTRHAPYMDFPMNILFGNLKLFSPVIRKIMLSIPQTRAMLSTGLTFTACFAGNPDFPHIRAQEASATLMLRCVREEDLYAGLEKIRAIGRKYGVTLREEERDYCEPTDFTAQGYRILERVLNRNFPDVIVAPYLLTAGTDARRFTGLADSILRFAPIDLNKEQFASIHGANEHIFIENIGECVLFYRDFMKEFQKEKAL